MKTQDYHVSMSANVGPQKAFDAISHVSDWWATDFEGHSQELGDRFTIRFVETFVNFELVELVPGQKVSWLVTDCHLHGFSDKKEWKGTKVVWEVSASDGATRIDFTHIGLVPAVECYNNCEQGWNFFIKGSFFKLITEGKGMPNAPRNIREEVMQTAG